MCIVYHLLGLINGSDPACEALHVYGLLQLGDVSLLEADDLLEVVPALVVDSFKTSENSLGLATKLSLKVEVRKL